MPTPVYCGVINCDYKGTKKELVKHKKLKHAYWSFDFLSLLFIMFKKVFDQISFKIPLRKTLKTIINSIHDERIFSNNLGLNQTSRKCIKRP